MLSFACIALNETIVLFIKCIDYGTVSKFKMCKAIRSKNLACILLIEDIWQFIFFL